MGFLKKIEHVKSSIFCFVDEIVVPQRRRYLGF